MKPNSCWPNRIEYGIYSMENMEENNIPTTLTGQDTVRKTGSKPNSLLD